MSNRINFARYHHETAQVETLEGTMPYYQVGTERMAQQLGISTQLVLELLSHKRALTTQLARKIESTSGLSADLLLELDADYQRNPKN